MDKFKLMKGVYFLLSKQPSFVSFFLRIACHSCGLETSNCMKFPVIISRKDM